MTEFEVTVYTKVKETYYVEAENEQSASEHWSDSEPVQSECIEIEEVWIKEVEND